MKKIEAIIRPSKLEALKDALMKANVSGLTISQVMGAGNQHGYKEYYRGNEVILNVLPKVKLEIVTSDNRVDDIVDTIIEYAQSGDVGDGKIFISEILECIRIRTRDQGENAL